MARLKRILKRLAIALAILVAIVLLANAGYSWWIGRQLETRLTALRGAGTPTSFAELAPKPIPPEDDAAAQLAQLAPQLKAFSKEYVKFLERTPLGKAYEKRQDQGLGPTQEQATAMRAILARYNDVSEGLEQVAACPSYASRIDYSAGYPQMMAELLEPCSDVRTAARFLRWQITVLLADDQVDEAIQTGLTILRLARLHASEPALVNGLVAIAVGGIGIDGLNLALRTGPIPTALHQQLDKELEQQDTPQRMAHMLKTERAINLSASQGMFAQGWWIPWVGRGAQLDAIDFYDRLLPLLERPWRESRPQIARLGIATHRTPFSGVLNQLMMPALQAALDAYYRQIASLRALRIVNSITAYTDQQGHPPTGLKALKLPAAATLDPFSGKPLKLKQTDAGWVVYTVFKNGTDDGGDFKDQADWGLAPAGYASAE